MDLNQFRETKNALLRYYASSRDSQGVHLIGFVAGLFTLIQTVQHSRQEPLSGIFSDVGAILFELSRAHRVLEIVSSLVATSWQVLKFPIFIFSIIFLLFFIIRAIFRFALFAHLSEYLIRLKPSEISERTEPIHDVIHTAVVDNIDKAKQKVFWVFPLIWFISRGNGNQYWKGQVMCLLLAICSTLTLMLFLW